MLKKSANWLMKPFTYYFFRKATIAERALYEKAEKDGFPGLTIKNGGIKVILNNKGSSLVTKKD